MHCMHLVNALSFIFKTPQQKKKEKKISNIMTDLKLNYGKIFVYQLLVCTILIIIPVSPD